MAWLLHLVGNMNTTLQMQVKGLAVAGALALVAGTFLTACATGGSDRSSTLSNKNVERVSEKTFKFKGTIVYHRQGDYYSIVSDRGLEYYPLNLKDAYRRSGLRVQVYGETHGYAKGGKMRALEIWEISRPGNE
jgi:hypothetical protein